MDEISRGAGKRHRSPAYPSFGLAVAIEKAEAIYRAERRHEVSVHVIAQHCGYGDAVSSSGARAVAALKQYGLLLEEGENQDRKAKLSKRAIDIIVSESADAPERVRAIKEAALAPPLHRKIWEHFSGSLPSRAALRVYLVRDLDFNDAYVDKFVKQLHETIQFARLDIGEGEPDEEEVEESEPNSVDPTAIDSGLDQRGPTHTLPQSPAAPMLHTGLAADCIRLPITLPTLKVVWIELPKHLTAVEFETLLATLDSFRKALVEDTTNQR